MFDCSLFQDLKAEGIGKELIESIQERIEQRESQVHEQAATLGVFLSPTTMNRQEGQFNRGFKKEISVMDISFLFNLKFRRYL